MSQFKPTVDPWDLIVEHNQRIQILEGKLQHVYQEVRALHELQQLNQQTINKMLDSLVHNSELNGKMAQSMAEIREFLSLKPI